ncbi:MAG TPA: hypothetical protein P5514_00980 [Bacteroidales bacterium]|nr:hypothetical protein [Bacteroidales bacterium]HRX95488.1 hypothetical protein [Bacteroidales bacterium]
MEKAVESRVENIKIVVEKMPDHIPDLNYFRKDDSLNAALIISEQITENIKTQEIDFLDFRTDFLINCNCELDSGELKIKISNSGGWIYRELNIGIFDSIQVNHYFANDINAKRTSPQYVRIEISNLKPNISDTIFGKILSIHDTIYKEVEVINDIEKVDMLITEKFSGYFRCKVKNN